MNQQNWQFTPTSGWSAGKYSIVIDSHFEDLAAHSIGRPFEVTVGDEKTTLRAGNTVTLPLLIETPTGSTPPL